MKPQDLPPQSFAAALPLDRLAGLRPRAWVCVGAGFSREEVKALVLARGGALVGASITSVPELAERVVGATRRLRALEEAPAERRPARVSSLGPLARQEALRLLLANPRILARTPELKRLRRQSGF